MRRLFAIALLCALMHAAAAQEEDDPKSSSIISVPDAGGPVPPRAPLPSPSPSASPSPSPKPSPSPSPSPTPSPSPAGESGLREVPVPKGQALDSVKVPGTISDGKNHIGEPILDIRVIDNTKTDKNTVEYIADVKRGQVLSAELLERVRNNLLSVGLFKSVNVFYEPYPDISPGVRLVISAKDNLSWIIAPLFVYTSAEVGGGLAYAESNAFGQNKKFLVLGQYTTVTRLLFVAWLDPQIRNTRWYYRVDLLVRGDNIREFAAGHYGRPRLERETEVDTFGGGALLGINITRHLHADFRLKLYYDNIQPSTCFNTTNRDGSGTPDVVAEQGGYCRQAGSSGWDNTLNLSLAWDDRSKVYGVLHGLKVQLDYQYGATWLGDRQNYHLISAAGSYSWRFFQEHNLNLKLGFDVFLDAPFKLEVEYGGATGRGYLYRQYRGDTDVRATLEYVVPLFGIKGLLIRAIGFYDTNLTWFRDLPATPPGVPRVAVRDHAFRNYLPDTPSGVTGESWHNGIGAGLRFFLKGVVLPLVGVDVAYGFPPPGQPFDSASWQVYLALGSTLD